MTERRTPQARASDASGAQASGTPSSRRRTTGGSTAPSTDADPRTARIIAVANQKGGVGKSTTAVSLGAALAELGHRALVVDLDPQGNASTGLGIRHESRDVTVYDVLSSEAELAGAIVETPVANLFAVPSTIDLAGAEIELVSQFSRELRLRRALEPLRDGPYGFILLDCPPSLGLLTVNALAAAAELLVPIQCEYYALEGLGQLLRNVKLVQQNVNPGLKLSGIVMTMFDPRTKLSEQVVEEVRRYFGDLVYDTVIPRTVRLSEAPGFGQPITVYDPRSRGAECYRDLAKEVAGRPIPQGPLPSFDEVPEVVIEAPRPEPMPRSAPHPMREAARDEEQADLRHDDDSIAPSAPEVAASPFDPDANVDVEPGRHDTPPDRTSDEATMSEPEVDGTVEPDAIPGPEASAVEPDAMPGPEASAGERPAPSSAALGDAPSEPSDADIEREVVVIDAYDLDPDAAAEAVAAPDPSPNGAETGEEDDGPRKRWSLFRRGGRR